MLQEYHFILKKIIDRVAKKTAADVDATAAARATASAALAAVPGGFASLPPDDRVFMQRLFWQSCILHAPQEALPLRPCSHECSCPKVVSDWELGGSGVTHWHLAAPHRAGCCLMRSS